MKLNEQSVALVREALNIAEKRLAASVNSLGEEERLRAQLHALEIIRSVNAALDADPNHMTDDDNLRLDQWVDFQVSWVLEDRLAFERSGEEGTSNVSDGVFLIAKTAADRFKVTEQDLFGQSRARPLPEARAYIYHLVKEVYGDMAPASFIGNEFGRDHTTILHALKTYPRPDFPETLVAMFKTLCNQV
jgi:hypothetical protein